MCAWSGGTFSRSNGTYTGSTVWAQDKAAGTKITAANHDTHDQDLATGINACLTKDGSNSPSANLPMGGYKHTNVAEGSARTDYARVSQVQDGALMWGATSGGSANAYTVTLTPAITAYAAGLRVAFVANHTNTGAATININSLGTRNILRPDGTSLTGGEILINELVHLAYNGTNFYLIQDSHAIRTWTTNLLNSGGSIPSITTNLNQFQRFGRTVHFSAGWNFDISTSVNHFTFDLPVTPSGTNYYVAGYGAFYTGSAWNQAFVVSGSTTSAEIRLYNNGSFGVATGCLLVVHGTIRTA